MSGVRYVGVITYFRNKYIAHLLDFPKPEDGIHFTESDSLNTLVDEVERKLRYKLQTILNSRQKITSPKRFADILETHVLEKNQIYYLFSSGNIFEKRRINITMSEDVIRNIDQVSLNRSEFIEQAVKDRLSKMKDI